mgnify:CR=1 FL=1
MRRQNNNLTNIITLIVLALIVAGGAFIYFSPKFEKESPKISFDNSGFWNLKDSLNAQIVKKDRK